VSRQDILFDHVIKTCKLYTHEMLTLTSLKQTLVLNIFGSAEVYVATLWPTKFFQVGYW